MASIQARSNAGDTLPVRALFQTDPSWYEHYWYSPARSSTPSLIRSCFAAVASSVARIAHQLTVERPIEHARLPELQDAH